MSKRAITLLKRLEVRAWADANNAALVDAWRYAAAHVSGTLSMQAKLLAQQT